MIENFKKAVHRFSEGFDLTPDEQREFDTCERKNRENDETIMGGYSVGSRKYRTPEIPDLLERIRRGFQNVFLSGKPKGPR